MRICASSALFALVACGDSGTPDLDDTGSNDTQSSSDTDSSTDTTTTPDETTSTPTNTGDIETTSTSEDSSTATDSSTESTDDSSTPTDSTTETGETTEEPENEPACADNADTATLEAMIDAVCAQAFSCCEDAEAKSIMGNAVTDAASCKTAMMAAVQTPNPELDAWHQLAQFDESLAIFAYALNPMRGTVREGCMKACVDSYTGAECNADGDAMRCQAPTQYPGAACDIEQLVRGTLPQGAFCNSDLAAAGHDVECKYGYDCLEFSGSYRCISVATEGEACTPDAENPRGDCEKDLFCDPTAMTCKPASAMGESCDNTAGAMYQPCMAPFECGADDTCILPCSEGASCADADDKSDDYNCPAGLSCLPGAELRCAAPGAADAACDSDDDCAGDLYCDTATSGTSKGAATVGKCVAPGAVDADCTRDAQCAAGNHCADTDKCAANLAEDVSCERSAECSDAANACAFVDKDKDDADVAFAARCVDAPVGSGACKVADPGLLDSAEFGMYAHEAYAAVQPAGTPWVSVCDGGGCETAAGVDGVCTTYAAADADCDNLPATGKPSCGPGHHCVLGKCNAFRGLGEACERTSNDWKATDDAFKDGFTSRMCNPANSYCAASVDGYVCQHRALLNTDANICNGL